MSAEEGVESRSEKELGLPAALLLATDTSPSPSPVPFPQGPIFRPTRLKGPTSLTSQTPLWE